MLRSLHTYPLRLGITAFLQGTELPSECLGLRVRLEVRGSLVRGSSGDIDSGLLEVVLLGFRFWALGSGSDAYKGLVLGFSGLRLWRLVFLLEAAPA